MDYRLNFLKPRNITEYVTCQGVIAIIKKSSKKTVFIQIQKEQKKNRGDSTTSLHTHARNLKPEPHRVTDVTLFCHARNMTNHYSICLTHINQAVVRSVRHATSQRRLNESWSSLLDDTLHLINFTCVSSSFQSAIFVQHALCSGNLREKSFFFTKSLVKIRNQDKLNFYVTFDRWQICHAMFDNDRCTTFSLNKGRCRDIQKTYSSISTT